MLGALCVSGVAGMDMDSTVAYQAFALMLGSLLASACFGWLFRPRFSAARRLPRFGTVGQPFDYRVVVLNRAPRLQTGLVLLEDLADTRPKFPEWKARQLAEQKTARSLRFSRAPGCGSSKPARHQGGAVPPLPPNGEVEVRLEVVPLRRGVLRSRGARWRGPDPLGLFRALAGCSCPTRS